MPLKFMKDKECYDPKEKKWFSTPQDPIDLLVDVYSKYCVEHNLPLVSADEQDKSQLPHYQEKWSEAFAQLWDLAS